MRKLAVCIALAWLAACARVMAPSGGPRDLEAPRIIETFPVQNADATSLAGTNQPVRIVFHETLSERTPRDMVLVSPETGDVRAERDGNEIRVRVEGGWQPGKVYRVTVLPGVVDRHGNARKTAYELLFSTGAAISQNALGGLATDRITGKPVVSARVEAVLAADSTIYTTVTDSAGFFALRSLPPGQYTTRIYSDQNRNREIDRGEARGTRALAIGNTDTLAIELELLAPDTTPGRLLRADIRDSLQVRLTFDDYLQPEPVLQPMRVSAWQLPDSTVSITGGTVMTVRRFEQMRGDTARAAPGIAAAPAAVDTTRLLPVNELVWVPPTPLRPSTRYRIIMSGYRNIHNIGNGGGSVTVTSPAPPRVPPPAPADSIRR